MSNANEVVVRYLAAWNEPEPKRRRELVAKAWTDDGTYVDAARDGKGHDSLDAMIATAQGHFPGYRLRLASGIEDYAAALEEEIEREVPDPERRGFLDSFERFRYGVREDGG